MKKLPFSLAALFLGATLAGVGRAAEPEANPRDALVFKDGDRLQGRLVEKTDEMIVFQSDRFGQLRVPAANAVVIRAEKPAESPAAAPGSATAPAAAKVREKITAREAERMTVWEWFSPAVLTARVRDFFGPWHGRLAFSTELVSDTAERTGVAAEMQLQRKWKFDEVQLKGRYDFSETNDLATTDLLKADGLWRHDFSRERFALYRPSLEWNRASFNNGVPNDYVLLQQEIGAGFSLFSTPARKVRVGVSENLFDVWNTTPAGAHSSRTVESTFLETELKLPWRMSLAQRGVYYYSFASGTDGWEDRIELSKKFTETLSTAIRHEIRRYNPDGTTQDYTRLKLLLGLDF